MTWFSVLSILILSIIGANCQTTTQDPLEKVKTDLYIVAGVLGGICLLLLIGLIVVCVTFNRLKKAVPKSSPAPKMMEDPVLRYNQAPVPPPRPESRPLGGYQSGADSGSTYGYGQRPTRYEGGDNRMPMTGRNMPVSSPYGPSVGGGRTNPAYLDDNANRGRAYGY